MEQHDRQGERDINQLVELAREHGDRWFTPMYAEGRRSRLLAKDADLFDSLFREVSTAEARKADDWFRDRLQRSTAGMIKK